MRTNGVPITQSIDSQSQGAETRERIKNAVLKCIVELGFYRASSNQVAQRAGVSWGAIQHHFGSRSQLMLEVARDILAKLDDDLRAVDPGEQATPHQVVAVLADLAFDHYRRPEFLVADQILIDLSRSPTTRPQAFAVLKEYADGVSQSLDRILATLLGQGEDKVRAGRAMFAALRGLALSEQLSVSFTGQPQRITPPEATSRDLLVRALTLFVEAEFGGRANLPTSDRAEPSGRVTPS
jgi:AcrR family transcriptional regulator